MNRITRVSNIFIALALVCLLPVRASEGEVAVVVPGPPSSSVSWQALLDKAEPFYQISDYKSALPFYVQAGQAATASNAANADKMRCLRYLADCYCRMNHPDEALALYQQGDSLIAADDNVNRIINLNDEAACLGFKNDYAAGEKLCGAAEKLSVGSDPEMRFQSARTQAQLAYFEYMKSKYAAAITGFQQAERIVDELGRKDVPALALRQKLVFAQAGSYYHLRDFEHSYQQFKRVYDLDARLFGLTDLQTGWAMLALSDVFDHLHQSAEADAWLHKACYVFRLVNRDRLYRENADLAAKMPDLQQRINQYIFGDSTTPPDMRDSQPPLCADSSVLVNTHDPRGLYARPFTDAPGTVWLNPRVERRGIVIAIHGLSLQHSSYDALAKRLADKGFCTVAFDVRGFGAYRQALGAEQLDMDGCLRDLHQIVREIRVDNPGVPLFILGESMGGAIALQFAAQNREYVDGLIASVPAGKRFHEKKRAVRVAISYLEDKNRPIDIGTDVINQATHNPKVKAAWAGDPNTRGELSPKELLAFRQMLKRNLVSAKEISALPVIIFQGVSDGLVKPEATYDLFRAVSSKDKSLVMVGNAEHLIFEEGCFTEPVLKGLIAWMESHMAPPKS